MKVFLRTKAISGDRSSLYLDFYPPIINPGTGKATRREFLNLHLVDKPRTTTERDHNKETKILAENIRARRQIEIQNGSFGFIDRTRGSSDFLQYFKELTDKRKESRGNHDNWKSSLNYLASFSKGTLSTAQLTPGFCEAFKEFLLSTRSLKTAKARLSQNAAHSYFNKFRAGVSEAFRAGVLAENPITRIKGIKQAETAREFLTKEELDLLVKTECDPPRLREASLFSVLTGLRWSDLTALTWSQIHHSAAQGNFIRFVQRKTKGEETLPVSEAAIRLLGPRADHKDRPFGSLKYSGEMNSKLKLWVAKSGIQKNITFHCFRHTYATLQLSNGTDIYTVSKLLGHRDLKTTQIYAKVIDQKKRDAVDKIKLDL